MLDHFRSFSSFPGGELMAPELAKTRLRRVALLLDRVADVWLVLALLTGLFLVARTTTEPAVASSAPLLVLALALGLGLKLWARRTLKRSDHSVGRRPVG